MVEHKHNNQCKFDNGGFMHYLVDAAPEVFWFKVLDVGDYQGQVFAIGLYGNDVLIYEDYYGSCGGCGAWGEGGEPVDLKDVLSKSKNLATLESALVYIEKLGCSALDESKREKLVKAVQQAFSWHRFADAQYLQWWIE